LLFDALTKPSVDKQGNKSKPKMTKKEFIELVKADPTTRLNNIDIDTANSKELEKVKAGKYVQWLIKNYLSPKTERQFGDNGYEKEVQAVKETFMEDLYKVTDDLKKFERFKNRLPENMRDINKLSPSSLYNAVKDFDLTIATTRPETIMADAAICVNPLDERYIKYHGKKVFIPLINREISIIADEYVSLDFGTGCLKVTPAHDLNDYELGIKHKLPVIDLLNDDGTLNEKAVLFVGLDRFEARKRIVKQLTEEGFLVKTDEYKSTVGTSERTGAVIEPKLSLQWFLKMEDLAKPALEHVMNDDIQLHPAKFKNTYPSGQRVYHFDRWPNQFENCCFSR
jgi:hypothetical protein